MTYRDSRPCQRGETSGTAYLHTQIGWAMIVPVEIGCLVCLYVALTRQTMAGWITFALLSLASTLFFGLTVVGTRETLMVRFGVGVVKKTFRIKEIASIQAIRTSILDGWGIRLMRDGTWLFNVSGFRAVKITMLNGRSYAVGSDEPEKLIAFLESARRA